MSEDSLASQINHAIPGRLWILIYEGTEEGAKTIIKLPHKISNEKIIKVLQNVIEELEPPPF